MKQEKINLNTFQSEKSAKPLTKDQQNPSKGGQHGEGFIPPPSW